jgi:hypothetical protein
MQENEAISLTTADGTINMPFSFVLLSLFAEGEVTGNLFVRDARTIASESK